MIKLPMTIDNVSIIAKVQHFYDYMHSLKNSRNMDFVAGEKNCSHQEIKNLEDLENIFKKSFNHILYKEEFI